MIGLAFDENFNHDILRGMLRRNSNLDGVRLQDVGLSGKDDPTVLEWAAQQGRVLISHDVSTITAFAYARVEAGKADLKWKDIPLQCQRPRPEILFRPLIASQFDRTDTETRMRWCR